MTMLFDVLLAAVLVIVLIERERRPRSWHLVDDDSKPVRDSASAALDSPDVGTPGDTHREGLRRSRKMRSEQLNHPHIRRSS